MTEIKIGNFATLCCHHDLHEIKTANDVAEIVEWNKESKEDGTTEYMVWDSLYEATDYFISQSNQTLLNKLEEEVEKLTWYIDQQDDYCSMVETQSSKEIWKDDNPLISLDDIKSIIAKLKRGGE